jgi:ribose transport system permease protein
VLRYAEAVRPLAGRIGLSLSFINYERGLTLGVGLLFLIFLTTSDSFRSPTNLQDMTLPITTLGLVSIGIAFGLICGTIDLSVGAIMGACGVFTAGLIDTVGLGAPMAIVLALIMGVLLGLVNGVLVTTLRIPSFIITLGTLTAYRALAERLQLDFFGKLQSKAISSEALNFFGSGEVIGRVPVSFYIFLGVALVGYYVLAHTKIGIWFFAVGGNQRAAYAAGITPDRIRILAFLISGFTSAMAGIVLTARFQASLTATGTGFEFEAITAVIIGGASLFGGAGSMVGTMLGVLLLRILINGLTHLDVVFYDQLLIRAGIFIAVLWVDATFRQGRRIGTFGG